ncbi:MAG TPA: LysR family transcriptional regulator [Burkholderiaceae bacterium]|nr:LysR family transcriptional regulator [Burkholderiaceae bacterium]
MSRSVLSYRIKAIESRLGSQLLICISRSAGWTEAGYRLLVESNRTPFPAAGRIPANRLISVFRMIFAFERGSPL